MVIKVDLALFQRCVPTGLLPAFAQSYQDMRRSHVLNLTINYAEDGFNELAMLSAMKLHLKTLSMMLKRWTYQRKDKVNFQKFDFDNTLKNNRDK